MFKMMVLICAVILLAGCTTNKNKVELVLDTKSALGEGAIWNHTTGELLWVDITGKILNFYNPSTGFNKEMFTGKMIGTVVPDESGNVIVALEDGIYLFDVNTGAKKFIIDPESQIEGNRFNDGKCDPAGRLWTGTMSLTGQREAGALYRFDGDSSIHKMIGDVSTSNGIVWTADHQTMYYIDTPTQKVMAWDYDNNTGEISNPRTAIEIDKEMGAPDGMTIDSDGNVWIALWGGAAVGCWNPESGELLRKIEVPARNVTSVAFGDNDLGTLYITTARQYTGDEDLEKFPNSGGLFKIKPGVKGVEAYLFKGKFQ